tara:strand:+ start:262 stop:438 length:177 start_codon:yes stop_codon:yes gene_type:complete
MLKLKSFEQGDKQYYVTVKYYRDFHLEASSEEEARQIIQRVLFMEGLDGEIVNYGETL